MPLQTLSDPSGNSFIENPLAPASDPRRTVSYFARSTKEDHALGIYTQDELKEAPPTEEKNATIEEEDEEEERAPTPKEEEDPLTKEALENEVLRFPTTCPECGAPCWTNMKVTSKSENGELATTSV